MFCEHCGTQNPDDSAFCGRCGEPVAALEPAPMYRDRRGEPPRPAGRFGTGESPDRRPPLDRPQPDEAYPPPSWEAASFDRGFADDGAPPRDPWDDQWQPGPPRPPEPPRNLREDPYQDPYGDLYEERYQEFNQYPYGDPSDPYGDPSVGPAAAPYDDYYEGAYPDSPADAVPDVAYGDPSNANDYDRSGPFFDEDPYRMQYLSQQQYRAEHDFPPSGPMASYARGPIPSEAHGPIKENRNLALYIVLSVVTLGIYGWYYCHRMAKDTNTLCAADGEHTTTMPLYLLFCLCTLSIYSYYWIYRLAERLYQNAPAYGLHFRQNGLVILLWSTVGILVIVGPFVAQYHVLRELNELSREYNARYAFANRL